jgi:amino-acid N-acetyltransferase
MIIRKLQKPDIERALELLAGYGLPTDDFDCANPRSFWVAEKRGKVIGVGGVDCNNSIGLARSFAVDKEFQRKGVGKKIYAVIEGYARNKNILQLYILTTTAQTYFEKLGDETIEKNIAPTSIKQASQFSALCPQSAVLMLKNLKQSAEKK